MDEEISASGMQKLAANVFLIVLTRVAIVIGLPMAGYISSQMYVEFKEMTKAVTIMQVQISGIVEDRNEQNARITRLEDAVFIPRRN